MKRFLGIVLVLVLVLVPMTVHAQTGFYPEDVFGSLEQCSQYFERCDQNTFEEIDGEMVMTVPLHSGIDWMYSKAPVSYETYTVSFDFALPASDGSEANLLFAMTGDGNLFNQVSFINSGGNLYLVHYQFTGTAWNLYEDDHMMFASYEGDTWCHANVEFTPDEINIYIDDEYALTLSETPDYSGSNGYIGLRCGSADGFQIKNFMLTEGLLESEIPTEEPTEEPTVEPTEVPTQEPTLEPTKAPTEEPTVEATEASTQVPTQTSTQKPTEQEGDSSILVLWLAIAGVVVVAGIVGVVIYLKKGKK